MEVDAYVDETDQCMYTLYNIIQEDYDVPQSDALIRNVDIDELGTIYTADDLSLSVSHHPYVSLDNSGPIHVDNMLEHGDNNSIDVQEMVEEEVNIQCEIDGNADSEYCVNHRQVANDQEARNAYIEYIQNVVIFCCYVCDQNFTRLQTLKGHVKRQHGITCDVSRVVEELLPIATACRQCGYVGTTQQAVCLHATRKHRLAIDRAPRQFKTDPRRLMLNRQRMDAEKAAYPFIVCLICKSKIGLIKNYSEHIKRHHRNDSMFTEALSDVRRIQFERTRRSHDGVVVNCETCGELCDENRLIAHIRWKHSDDINVKQLVSAAHHLVRSSKQQRMMKMRSELVSCAHCGRRLRQISLANHIKFYCSAVQPAAVAGKSAPNARCYVECNICHQSMPRPKLFRHRRLVHHIGSYKQLETFMCEFCPREFTEHHQLRAHVKKHTGIYIGIFLVFFICTIFLLCTFLITVALLLFQSYAHL